MTHVIHRNSSLPVYTTPASVYKPYEVESKRSTLGLKDIIKECSKGWFFLVCAGSFKKISPKRARVYQFRSANAFLNADSKDRTHKYRCKVVGKARNMAEIHIIRKGEDVKAAKELKKVIVNSLPKRFEYNDSLENPTINGVCLGISIDTAERLLVKGESIDSIIASSERGASAEAAANQANYQSLADKTGNIKFIQSEWISNDYFVGNHEDHPLYLTQEERDELMSGVEKLLMMTLPGFENRHPNIHQVPSLFDDIFENLISKAKVELEESKGHPWLVKFADEKWLIKDYVKFKEEAMKIADPQNERLLDAIIALRNVYNSKEDTVSKGKKGIKVVNGKSDFTYLISITKLKVEWKKFSFVAEARNIKVIPVKNKSILFKNDHDYIKLLNSTPPGLYGMCFYLNGGAHIINILKNDDGSYYILDPNMPQVRAKDYKQAEFYLTKLLSDYSCLNENPDPKKSHLVKRPWQKEHNYHEISFYKFEALHKV